MRTHERAPETVTASEVASWVYCEESWRLTQLGYQPTNQRVRDAGEQLHLRKARVERFAGLTIHSGMVLLGLGLLALLILIIWIKL